MSPITETIRRPIGTLLVLVFLSCPWPTQAADDSPIPVVEVFHEALLATMKDAEALGVEGRFTKLEPAVSSAFHLPAMIQVASGSHWKKADEKAQDQLIAAFSRLSVATYAAQFDGYSGQSFETLGNKPGPQKTTLVETRIVNPGDDSVAITYVMKKAKGVWRIVDVLVDTGISELARKRSEYRRVLKAGGIPALVDTLKKKADDLLLP